MANLPSHCLFFLYFFLLTLCSSGTQVGISCNARGSLSASSLSRTVSFLEHNKVFVSKVRVFVEDHRVLTSLADSNVSVDLYLDETLLENFTKSKSFAALWLKNHVVNFLPSVNIKSVAVRAGDDLSRVLTSLKLIHTVLRNPNFDSELKVSAVFSMSLLENLEKKQENDLHRVLGFIKRINSFVIVEGSADKDVELSMGDLFVQSIIKKATVATSVLPCSDVHVVFTAKTLIDPSAEQVAKFAVMFSESFQKDRIAGQIAELYVEVSSVEGFAEKELMREHEQIFPSARRDFLKSVSHDVIDPPIILPPNNPTPNIVTVPATTPVTVTPANPASTPVQIPSTTPVLFPPANPAVISPAPVTNPVTTPATPVTVPGMQPVTNPVTTYPVPPLTAPPVNPVTPPATTNAPAIPGQSWCVAKSGVSETALQQALDYACGMGGADCSQIQQGGSCYNPNTLQNHASYAFNSYYQKNPVATSCDFGGSAAIVGSNPSTGSCVFPSSASSSPSPPSSTSSLPTPSTPPTNPATTPSTPIMNPATTPSAPGAGDSGTGTPSSVLNSSTPGAGSTNIFGPDTPGLSSSTSKSACLHPYIEHITLVVLFVARKIIMEA